MLSIDHIVIATTDLAAGTAAIEARLGVPLAQGGEHAAMGTHNRLLSLGPEIYLEVIAINPDAPPPGQPRWYALDSFTGPARLTHWAARTDNLDAALDTAPTGAGNPWDLERGDLRWRMAVPETGQTPFDGLFPALLEWQTPHPAPRLPDQGVRLSTLTLFSPETDGLSTALSPVISDPRVNIVSGENRALTATFETPMGTVTL